MSYNAYLWFLQCFPQNWETVDIRNQLDFSEQPCPWFH